VTIPHFTISDNLIKIPGFNLVFLSGCQTNTNASNSWHL
jgi:hypothetical protein